MDWLEEVETFYSGALGANGVPLWANDLTIGQASDGPLQHYPGVYILERNGSVAICAPLTLYDAVCAAAFSSPHASLIEGEMFLPVFDRPAIVLGPAFHAFADAQTLVRQSGDSPAVREVHRNELGLLQAACTQEEWAEGGFLEESARLFVLEANDEVVAAANLTSWRYAHDDVGLITHPDFRGRGFGTRLAAHVAGVAVEERGIVRYRARVDNTASVKVFEALGFTTYCRQTAVRPV